MPLSADLQLAVILIVASLLSATVVVRWRAKALQAAKDQKFIFHPQARGRNARSGSISGLMHRGKLFIEPSTPEDRQAAKELDPYVKTLLQTLPSEVVGEGVSLSFTQTGEGLFTCRWNSAPGYFGKGTGTTPEEALQRALFTLPTPTGESEPLFD